MSSRSGSWASGEREEGTIYSAQLLINKASGAIGVWGAGLILELVDFPTAASAVEVTAETGRGLMLAVMAFCLVFYPAALLCLSRFRIDRAEHRSDLDRLRVRLSGTGTPGASAPPSR